MVDIIADPDRAWQTSMRIYFKEVDYHGLGQIFRKWNVRGTENQNGTWIDWNQVPDNCQKDVKDYVQKVVESRRRQKEWEEYVRRESIERSVNPEGIVIASEDDLNEKSMTFEERELAAKSENWNKKNYSKRASSSTTDEINPSQWVLDRVPYPLAQSQPQVNEDQGLMNITRWKKVGNLSHLILRDTHLRWVDEEYDPNYYSKENEWRKNEIGWWKNEDGSIRKPTNEENSHLDTVEVQRMNRATKWMSNRNKFSTNTQKTLRKFRDFLRQQSSRNNFLICPASWSKNRQEIPEDTTFDMEDELWQEDEPVEATEDDDKDWNMDEEEEVAVNPWDRPNEGEEVEKPKKKVAKKKKATKKKSAVKKIEKESVFESGTAVSNTPPPKTRKKKTTASTS